MKARENASVHLILLRHAEKNPRPELDPGLSDHGLAQADALARLLADKRWPRPDMICTSPKKRARQTIAPAAEAWGLAPVIAPDLDERAHGESSSEFRTRLRRMLMGFESGNFRCAIWCTHLDWIEEFRSLADCEHDLGDVPYDAWSPAQYLVMKLDDLWSVVASGKAP